MCVQGMDRNALCSWMLSAFGTTEQALIDGSAALIQSAGGGIGSILPMQRRLKAHTLFKAYDMDQIGYLDTGMFTAMCQHYDPSISAAGVAQTFEMVNAVNNMIDVVSFYR